MSNSYRQLIGSMIDRLAAAEQPLPDYFEIYRRVLMLQSETKPVDILPTVNKLILKAKQQLNNGKPALTFPDLVINWEDFQKIFISVSKLSKEFLLSDENGWEESNKIATNLVLLKETVEEWFEKSTVTDINQSARSNASDSLSGILQASIMPFLADHAAHILLLVNQETWYRNYCPVCGGAPDFAYLDKEKGARWLLCSRCNANWLFHRLICPHCGNDNMSQLSYFTDDKSLYRLYTCDSCYCYIKSIDLRKTEADILLPLERIMTLDMDKQAVEAGYKARR